MIKKCQLCEKEFETVKFGSARKFCFECSPVSDRASVITSLRQKSKEICVKKLGGACKKCGISKSYLLEFHHRDPKEKDEALATLARNYNLEKYFSEIQKCDLLCANCHREFHYFHTHFDLPYEDYLKNIQFESDL